METHVSYYTSVEPSRRANVRVSTSFVSRSSEQSTTFPTGERRSRRRTAPRATTVPGLSGAIQGTEGEDGGLRGDLYLTTGDDRSFVWFEFARTQGSLYKRRLQRVIEPSETAAVDYTQPNNGGV